VNFSSRYGPWAIVAGASEGLGRAFAVELARRGVGVVAVARRGDGLQALAADLKQEGADVITVAADLATEQGHAAIAAATAPLAIGLVVANAAYAPVGPVVGGRDADAHQAIAVNCTSPLLLVQRHAPAMVQRGRGGIVLMSSLAGLSGAPNIAVYAASKAFTTALGAGLWAELAPAGVHVTTCIAGAIATPNLTATKSRKAPGTLPPDVIARAALDRLGRGPRVVPGAVNRVAAVALGRLLPSRLAVRVMASSTTDLSPPS
jgi:short-subunit dehydrogenase